MRIALLGYGKMGRIIETVAIARGHEIVLKKDSRDSYEGLENADVAIEFSVPSAAVGNISACLERGIPVVSGTTGWLHDYAVVEKLCNEKDGSLITASNFSLGVNIFFEINRQLATIMSRFTQYDVQMQEVHHTQKLDAPSGTAITLAEDIIRNSNYKNWTLGEAKEGEIRIDAQRIDSVPGTHTVSYASTVDTIDITHTAHSREGFALGAVVAAEWLTAKRGIYTMRDVLGL
jgi:4-hydroxy-tetrahydrodipicolinate reductase